MHAVTPTILVQGHGQAATEPDVVILNFVVTAEDKIYAQAIAALNERTAALRVSLAEANEDPNDLKTTSFDVRTNHEYVKSRYVFLGFRGTHALEFRLDFDPQRLDTVFAAVTASPAQAQLSLVFTVSEPEAIRQRVLADAVANARARAEVIATASGQKLIRIVSIQYGYSEVRVSTQPYAMADGVASPVAPTITPAEIESEDTVRITWEIAGIS